MGLGQDNATCLQLDFQKAYDSLSRAFLHEVLVGRGFPDRFVAMVAAVHRGTSGRFLVNVFFSKPVDITSGIRQECPLAPLLFLVAIDVVYRRLERCEDIRDVCVDGGTELRAAGYADDTAVYLQDASMTPACLSEVGVFEAVSGLQVNSKKSVAIRLAEPAAANVADDGEISVLACDATCRYLGIQVGDLGWNGRSAALPPPTSARQDSHGSSPRGDCARHCGTQACVCRAARLASAKHHSAHSSLCLHLRMGIARRAEGARMAQ